MSLPPEALQFAGSLVAILVLAWLVRSLGLGVPPALSTESEAFAAANEVADGFVGVRAALDRDGQAALVQDSAKRIMLLKRHGVHFAGRVLSASASARHNDGCLVVDSGERRFGMVELRIEDADTWAEAINALDKADHA